MSAVSWGESHQIIIFQMLKVFRNYDDSIIFKWIYLTGYEQFSGIKKIILLIPSVHISMKKMVGLLGVFFFQIII
jgi:hypothetical protein